MSYFALADAIRTIKPSFRFTVMRLIMFFVYSLVVAIAITIGLCVFLLPGIYLGAKLSQTTFAYLIDEAHNPFAASWHITRGAPLRIIGFLAVITVLVALISMVCTFPMALIAHFFLPSVIVLGPLAFLVTATLSIMTAHASVTFYQALRQRATTPHHIPTGWQPPA